MRRLAAVLALGCLAAAPRILSETEEAQARALFREIRCVVCQNESIESSQAEIAADLRSTVREQVAAGRSEAEIRAFLVERYGEFVLFRPAFSAGNAALWATPFAVVLIGGGVWVARARRHSGPPVAAALEPWSPPEPDERNVT